MESIKQGANYVAETIQQATAGASKEANKEVAKDGNAPISTRLNAAGSAISDKADEKQHEGSANLHREAAKQ